MGSLYQLIPSHPFFLIYLLIFRLILEDKSLIAVVDFIFEFLLIEQL